MNLFHKAWKVLRIIFDHTEGFLLCVFGAMLVCDVLLGIMARYVRFDIVFATELGKYIFIWLCAIGISAAVRDNQHVRLDLVVSRLPIPKVVTWVISQLIFLGFSVIFFWLGLDLTINHYTMDRSTMGFDFPMYVFTAALPVGFGLTSIRLILDIVSVIRKNETEGRITSDK